MKRAKSIFLWCGELVERWRGWLPYWEFSSKKVRTSIKKHKFILAKKNLEEKIHAFGRKSNNRFELAIAFLKEANQAENIAVQESRPSREAGRDFLKKIGSNFRIADRTLVLDFKNAFKIAEKYHADPANAGEVPINFAKSENWRRGRDSNPREGLTPLTH